MPDYIIYVIKHESIPQLGHLYYTNNVPSAENNPVVPNKIESDSEYDYETSESESEPIQTPESTPRKKIVPKLSDKEKEKIRKQRLKKEKEEIRIKKNERLNKKLKSKFITEGNYDKRSTEWKFQELKRDSLDPTCYNYNSEICQEMRKNINAWKLVKLDVISGLQYKQEIAKEVLKLREKTGYTLKKYNELLGEVFVEKCKHYILREDCDICRYKCKHCRNKFDCIFCIEGETQDHKKQKEITVEINKIKLKLRELANENKEILTKNKNLTLENKELSTKNKNLTLEIKSLKFQLEVKIKEELKEEMKLKKEKQKKARQIRENLKLKELHQARLRREKETKNTGNWKPNENE